MPPPIQRSLSVYRGQSRSGEGEGPGRTVAHGEQYLRVDAPLMSADVLDAIRPWMTLDSDPADHQRLDDRLEAWSLFPEGGSLFVVRLVSAGVYDRRAAYFAHGRAWKRDALPAGFDPGLHLGRSDAFDAPWRDERPASSSPDLEPAVVRIEQVAAEQQTAARFLGHLAQAITENYPLIIAAPVADFAAGSALHALVCLARAGLPANLRRDCRLRIYSRFPELFLRQVGVHLLVVPEEAATAALTARPAATLLDRSGEKIAGKDLAGPMLEYATAVVERAVAIPDGLPFFAGRVRDLGAFEPWAIPVAYNVAFAFAGPPDRRGELLRRYLPRASDKLGTRLRWNDLIRDDEWKEFPSEALLDELLTDAGSASAGRRELLRAAEKGAARLGLRVDARLEGWWDARDDGKLARLVQLLAHDPPLVSGAAAARRTAEIPLERLAPAGSLAAVFDAEAKSGMLARRAAESEELAHAAAESAAVFAVLTREASQLDPEWARVYVRIARRDELTEAARRWLEDDHFFRGAWADVPALLLDRLRSLDPPPVALAQTATNAARKLDVAADLRNFLRLADVVTRIDEAGGRATDERLLAPFWTALPHLGEAGRAMVEELASDADWHCLRLRSLPLESLLVLASAFRKETSFERLTEELDARVRRDAEGTSEGLARSGWWFFWRRRSRLKRDNSADAVVLRRSALAWLSSSHWTSQPGAETTLEAWKSVMEDLPGIEGHEAAKVCGSGSGSRRWPWIPPFEEEQFDALIEKADDLGALAEFAEATAADRRWNPGQLPADHVLSRSSFSAYFPPSALAWLLRDPRGAGRPTLTIEESALLCAHAGHRVQQALIARGDAVAALLDRNAGAALRAAGDPDLWSDPHFLGRLAAWMNRKTLAEITHDTARFIDDHADGEPEPRVAAPSQALARELAEAGLFRAAGLLHRELSNTIEKQKLFDDVIASLIGGRADDPCWRRFAAAMARDAETRPERPIELLADRIRNRELTRDERSRLAKNGWQTFQSATRKQERAPRLDDAMIAQMYALAAVMQPPGSLGTAATQLVFSFTNPQTRAEGWWWQGLVKAMRGWKRYGEVSCADDREDAAFAVIFASLDRQEQSVLGRVLRRETQWWIPSEFGERTS